LPVSCHFQGCKAPLFRVVSGAISSELALPLPLSDAVAAWKLLESKLPCLDDRVPKQKFKTRYEQAITSSHLLAYLLHPQYQGSSLSSKERDKALEYANNKYPHIVPTLMKFQGHSKPFLDFQFGSDVRHLCRQLSGGDHTNKL